MFKQYSEKIAIIAATSRWVLTIKRTSLGFTVILPNPKELQIYSKVSWSSKCNPITKLNEKTLPLPLVIRKHPSASVKPLNHSMKLRDNTSFSPKGNPKVIDGWSVLSIVVQIPLFP